MVRSNALLDIAVPLYRRFPISTQQHFQRGPLILTQTAIGNWHGAVFELDHVSRIAPKYAPNPRPRNNVFTARGASANARLVDSERTTRHLEPLYGENSRGSD